MTESFEYAIRKDVRNNPIVREVDSARQRGLWKTAGIAVLFVTFVLFLAFQQFELVRHGYKLVELQRQRTEEEAIARDLRLELETLKAPGRIEDLATRRLHLVAPTREEAIVIERVVPADPPARSVVAQR